MLPQNFSSSYISKPEKAPHCYHPQSHKDKKKKKKLGNYKNIKHVQLNAGLSQ